ncbi:MAG: hypothetical protein U0X92_10755 [Anaerolineales bacterium]
MVVEFARHQSAETPNAVINMHNVIAHGKSAYTDLGVSATGRCRVRGYGVPNQTPPSQ